MDEKYMNEAIKEAKKALKLGEMPIGAVIVYENKIIARGYNKKELSNDPTMHAEMIVIRKASKKLSDWRLNKCSLYVTMEPCAMCMGAIVESRIENLFYGVENKKYHFINENITKFEKLVVKNGILQADVNQLMKDFFSLIRNR